MSKLLTVIVKKDFDPFKIGDILKVTVDTSWYHNRDYSVKKVIKGKKCNPNWDHVIPKVNTKIKSFSKKEEKAEKLKEIEKHAVKLFKKQFYYKHILPKEQRIY